ncbi:methyl-accepting chemotaxis protein [Rhizobium leguminosarum]|uniref:methyl-accepting chemotaxis protein n=2 Tax=Rhizobium/Agrobacterium group TaxID=227290 RepID=UPI003CCAACB1
MAEATTGLAEGLRHLADGNLVFSLDDKFAEDFEPLRANFNAAVAQLAESLRAVSNATESIDDGAQEISLSAQDLSRRTEHQAASLEQTAAALDQITQNVASSSKRTAEARHVAIEANKSARHSGGVVSSAVAAMQHIERSSSQISSIVGVIDEIAFQTNLLALNAGVEAARSGEAGKGFAVVAQEVRELAQRSAHAAKEIKDLILNSVDEVSSGVKLVRDTGEALKIIVDQIVLINTQLDAVTAASNEQSATLFEVNRTVNRMDQVTQQMQPWPRNPRLQARHLPLRQNSCAGLWRSFRLRMHCLSSRPVKATVKQRQYLCQHAGCWQRSRTNSAKRVTVELQIDPGNDRGPPAGTNCGCP